MTGAKQSKEFKDDLAFLNKFEKREEINKLSRAFKNAGRGLIREKMKKLEEGKWGPAIGTYKPNYKAVKVKESKNIIIRPSTSLE